MHNELTTRRLLAMVAAGAVVIFGLLGMWQPVYIDDYDRYGFQIDCGTGLIGDDAGVQLAEESEVEERSDECGTALLLRRTWSITAIIGGIAVVVALALRGSRVVNPQSR
jgi:hypothetical protein